MDYMSSRQNWFILFSRLYYEDVCSYHAYIARLRDVHWRETITSIIFYFYISYLLNFSFNSKIYLNPQIHFKWIESWKIVFTMLINNTIQ